MKGSTGLAALALLSLGVASRLAMAKSSFLDLPLEIRRMVYWQLLVMDHKSGDWGWQFDRIGALNKRHSLTWVSSQIRQEAQQVFYTSIPWHMRLLYHGKRQIHLEQKVLQILWKLEDWNQLRYICNIRLTFAISPDLRDYPSRGMTRSCSMHKLVQMFAAVKYLELSWLDYCRSIPWIKKERTLLQPLSALSSLQTCRIDYVNTRGQLDENSRFINRNDFLERVKGTVVLADVGLNPISLTETQREMGLV